LYPEITRSVGCAEKASPTKQKNRKKMSAQLKSKVIHGFAWNAAEKIASALFQMWVMFKVANRLFPEDYALVAVLTAFGGTFNTLVDSGFSQALIRKKDPAAKDFSSAFWFNMAMSAVIYALLVGVSYPMARLLDMPDLTRLAPVLYLVVPLNALSIIQQAVMTRMFDFRRISSITFAAIVISGLVAVGMAIAGFGVWSLVGQRVGLMASRAVLMWTFGRWRLGGGFSRASIREMFGYSSRLMATDLLNNIYNSVPQFIIGKIHPGTLGHYDMARKSRDLPVTATMNSMQAVTFPALSALADDGAKFEKGVGKVVGSIAFLMFPMMAGLVVVAGEMFGLFLAPQWQGAVPFFRILCLAGFATPIAVISGNILRARSDGKALIKAEIAKKVIAAVILAATIPFGAIPITCGMVGIAFSDATVGFTVAHRYTTYGFGNLVRDVLPTLGLTVVMAGAVWGMGMFFEPLVSAARSASLFVAPLAPEAASFAYKITLGTVLTAKIVTGVTLYLGGAALLKFDAFGEFIEVVKIVTGKIKG
jgi:O-antigen/teichoic acid export membrane protein